MSWDRMNEEERAALLARARLRGLTQDALSSKDDLIVGRRGVTLGETSRELRPTEITARTLDELITAAGLSEDDREAASASGVQREHRELLLRLAPQLRSERPGSQEWTRLTHLLISAALQGVLSRDDMKELGFSPFEGLPARVDVRQWLLPTIIVQSGSTLTFNPFSNGAGVHVLTAFRLVVEPNANIMINRVPVSIDCIHLEVQ
jgi:hypothetical protein